MKLIDLNILIYAVNADSPHHAVIRSWWEETLSGEEPVGLAWVVVLGFLRITTSARVFPVPLTPEQALDRISAWFSCPVVKTVREAEQHWRILRELLEGAGTAGNLTTDAHLAALAIANGATLVSCDNDFVRFQHLRLENPLLS